MKLNVRIFVCYLTAFLIASTAFSQNNKEAKGKRAYENLSYSDAIKIYEELAATGYKSESMLEQLANSYYFIANYEMSAQWFETLLQNKNVVEPEVYFRYAQTLKAKNNYKKAAEMLAKFSSLSKNDSRAKLFSLHKDYLDKIEKNSGRFIIKNQSVNTSFSDYGSSYCGNKIIFASSRDSSLLFSRKHDWTGEGFTNLYQAVADNYGNLQQPKKFSATLNSKFHESSAVFTKDGKTIYFTRNNFVNGKKGKNANRTTLLKLYRANLKDSIWTNVTALSFNSDNYSTAHPSLSADEKTLFFASDMPGTKGFSDIFKVVINDDGSFGIPENVGHEINTEGRETFPMITADNELYFASDGHLGLGGLDVFVANADKNGNFSNIQNVGKPINSSKDDFAFLIDTNTNTGYFSSNRDGGKGGDDIYGFKEIKKLECEHLLAGIVTDKTTALPINDATVKVLDENNVAVLDVKSDNDGKFNLGKIGCNKIVTLNTEKIGYHSITKIVETDDINSLISIPIQLERQIELAAARPSFKIGDDLFKILSMNMIYFDTGKWNIRKDAILELNKMITILHQNPSISIDIRSHTDCRMPEAYNLDLSNKRATATRNWLISNGIDKSRLSAKGFGESQLVNECDCKLPINCTEEQHQANRRSEFIVTKI